MVTTPKNFIPPTLNPTLTNIDSQSDRQLGETVADYKLAATARAFNDRYEQGIRSLFVAVDPKGDRKKGSELAAILLEERRKTLLAVSIRFTGYSFGLSLVGCMVGLQPLQLPLVCVPATVAAIIQSKN